MAKKETQTTTLPQRLLIPEFAALRKVILTKDGRAVCDYFDGMTEKERQKHAKYCFEWYQTIEKIFFSEGDGIIDENGVISYVPQREQQGRLTLRDLRWRSQWPVIATAGWSVLKGLRGFFVTEEFETILRSRRPDWTIHFLEKRAAELDLDFWDRSLEWTVYRRFVHEKIIEPSQADSMTELMFAALSGSRYTEIKTGKPGVSVLEELRKDPALIVDGLWNIFEITAFRRNWCFTTHDHFHHWKTAFCELIRDKTLPPDRVLDGCFRAIQRPFSDHHVKWFVQLLERLIAEMPINEDVLAGDPRFLSLLELSQPSPRGLGLAILERLLKKDKIDLRGIAGRLVPLLREEARSKPKKVLVILEKIARQRSDLRHEVFDTLLEGLRHETAEIQDASLNLLIGFDAMNDAATCDSVRKMADDLAASVRKRLADFLPATSKPTKPMPVTEEIAGLRATGQSLEAVREPIVPICNFDELLDLAIRLAESAHDPDEIERLLDGLSRLGYEEPEDFERKTAPLLKRIFRLMGNQKDYDSEEFQLWMHLPFCGIFPIHDCIYLLLTWVLKQVPTSTCSWEERPLIHRVNKVKVFRIKVRGRVWMTWSYPRERSIACPPFQLFSEHVKAIAERLARRESQQLLSTPTHRDGWIDPTIFAERLIEAHRTRVVPGEHDRVLALLRLDFPTRDLALREIEQRLKTKDEYVEAVRYALGASHVKIGKTPHYWIAAARCRSPFADDPAIDRAFPGYGPDAGRTASYTLKAGEHVGIDVQCSPSPDNSNVDWSLFPTVGLHTPIKEHPMNFQQEHRWKLLIWPQNLDPAIGSAIQPHSSGWFDAAYDTGFQPFIDVMQRRDVPIHKIGAAAIFTALAIKCSSVHTAAMDSLIITLEQGRLTPETMTEAVQEILPLDRLIVTRWLKPLKTTAEQSDHHAAAVRDLLENIVQLIHSKSVGGFLELLHELCILTGSSIREPACRRFLESLTGTGKAAKLAKKLL